MEVEHAAIAISILSLVVSVATVWLTVFNSGRLKMTRPATVFLGPDMGKEPKVYMRAMLFSTGKRGQVVENMYARVRRGESSQNFNVWVYGEDRLMRGSGLFVGHEGVTLNHYFLLPKDGSKIAFLAGRYHVEVYATILGKAGTRMIASIPLELGQIQADALSSGTKGVYFDWQQESQSYHSHVDDRPLSKQNEMIDLLRQTMMAKDSQRND